jgi:hypothetical protein
MVANRDILVACDETGANALLRRAQAALGTIGKSGSGAIGPFQASWSASASLSGGRVDLAPPNVLGIADLDLNYSLSIGFGFDLSSIIPDFCLPQVCVDLGPLGRYCTPRVCVDWPSVNITIPYSDRVRFGANFAIAARQDGGDWVVESKIVNVPQLQLSPAAAAILAAIGVAAGAVLAPIPFIGPFLGAAVAAILAAVGIAGVLGLLGPILTLFVAGLTFELFRQPRRFPLVAAASSLEPAVMLALDEIRTDVVGSDEDELVFGVDVS